MARQKGDGKGRLGGRTKGTPNRLTATIKDWLFDIVEGNLGQMAQDLQDLEPGERLKMLERFIGYLVPRQQAQAIEVTADVQNNSARVTEMSRDEIMKEINRLHGLRCVSLAHALGMYEFDEAKAVDKINEMQDQLTRSRKLIQEYGIEADLDAVAGNGG